MKPFLLSLIFVLSLHAQTFGGSAKIGGSAKSGRATGAAITLGVHAIATGDTTATTAGINTTGATLLIVGISYYASDTITISDSKSNTWIPLTNYPGAAAHSVQLFYAANPITVGSGHTFTYSAGSAVYGTLLAASFNNTKTSSPFDVENGASQGSGGTLATGSITPSLDGELVVTLAVSDPGSPTVDSGFTLIDSTATVGGVNVGGGLAYKVQTSAAAVNPTWTASTLLRSASIAFFKAP